MTGHCGKLGRAQWCLALSFVVMVAAVTRLTSAGEPGAGSEGPLVRLSPVRQVVLPAGRGPHAVGITPDVEEGGWGGPEDLALRDNGDVVIADTENRRVLVLDRQGRTKHWIVMPHKIQPYFVSVARSGSTVVAGADVSQAWWLAWVGPRSADGTSAIRSVRLPKEWWAGEVMALAADAAGTVYMQGVVGGHSLWRVPRKGSKPEPVGIPDRRDYRCWGLTRGANGRVYALMAADEVALLTQFDEKGGVAKTWHLSPLLMALRNEDLIGVDKQHRLYLAERITPDMLQPHIRADEWGYRVRCYALRDAGAELIARAEMRYAKGDMEDGDPGIVALGDGLPLALGADGSIVMRTATSRTFKLKFYPPPPWGHLPQGAGVQTTPTAKPK